MQPEPSITMDEARELVGDKVLWPRVRAFLWDFARLVHPSHLSGVNPVLVARMDSPRVRRHVLGLLGVEPVFHTFPADDNSRLLLLDGATLEAIAKWLGALSAADALRAVTAGPKVRALKAELPGIYPEVFAYAPYFRKFGLSGRLAETAPERIAAEGRATLASLLGGLPAQLLLRLKLMLPADAPTADESADSAPAADESAAPAPAPREGAGSPEALPAAALTLLLKLLFPEAAQLCSL